MLLSPGNQNGTIDIDATSGSNHLRVFGDWNKAMKLTFSKTCVVNNSLLLTDILERAWQSRSHFHYDDVIMSTIASQITSLTTVYSTIYSGADQSKHQSSASLAFVWGIHRGPVNSPHKWPVTRKMFPFDDVIMLIEFSMKSEWHSSSIPFNKPPLKLGYGWLINPIVYISLTVETLYNTINFCWSTHKRHSIARPKGRGMGCLLWVQRATYCVDLSYWALWNICYNKSCYKGSPLYYLSTLRVRCCKSLLVKDTPTSHNTIWILLFICIHKSKMYHFF